MDEEVGTFCGARSAEEMVDTDAPEAEARYLRAVYETTPPGDRAAVLAEEWFDLPSWRGAPSLQAVREALPGDLPDPEAFLPGWIAELRSIGADRPEVRRLLAEATEMHGGIDGLAALARDPAPGRAERYLDWVLALRRTSRGADATASAREALGRLEPYGETWARISEQLAELLDDDSGVQNSWCATNAERGLIM